MQVRKWFVFGRVVPGLALSGLLAGAVACDSNMLEEQHDGFTADEWARIKECEPLAGPQHPNPSNRLWNDVNAAKLGQMIFMDTEFSSAIKVDGVTGKKGEVGKVACVTCHDPNKSWIDSRTADGVSHGTGYTTRSSPTVLNLGWVDWFTWGGRMDSMSMQGANAPEAPTDVATSRLFFAHVLFKKYRAEYDAVFPEQKLPEALDPMHPEAARFPAAGKPKGAPTDPDGDWEKMAGPDRKIINQIMANSGKAIEAFERKLISQGSRFERYVKGEHKALTTAEKRGLRLFVGKASCNECHRGPVMSDNSFHNIGVPQAIGMAPPTDTGRLQDLPKMLGNPFNARGEFSDDPAQGKLRLDPINAMDPVATGQFKTPGLVNIADTAPYFHNGAVKTLEELVHFYNVGGGMPGTFAGTKDPKIKPLGLSPAEEADLVAFLRSLTGGPVPAEWAADTSKKL